MPEEKLPLPIEGESKIDLFKKKEVRKCMHDGEWWFSVKDVLEALVETTDGNRYSRQLRDRDQGLKSGWAQITRTLNFDSGKGGGRQDMTFINIEGIFRLMQSAPSQKAEPFKKWLARVGFERLQEIENPDLAIKRAVTLYRAKGYDDGWIDARIRNKVSRETLTAEWQSRGVRDIDYAILTDAISIETFGIRTARHKEIKGLKSQSLRDNMTPIELTLTTLGEQAATEITRSKDAQGRSQNLGAARAGGKIAGGARLQIEEATGQQVVSGQNYLTARQRQNNTEFHTIMDDTLQRILQLPGADPIKAGEIGTVS